VGRVRAHLQPVGLPGGEGFWPGGHGVLVAVGVGVAVGSGVAVDVLVGATVGVGVLVLIGVAVVVGKGVSVGGHVPGLPAHFVGVGVGTSVGVDVGGGIGVEVGTLVGVGVGGGVKVGTGVLASGVGPSTPCHWPKYARSAPLSALAPSATTSTMVPTTRPYSTKFWPASSARKRRVARRTRGTTVVQHPNLCISGRCSGASLRRPRVKRG
jgi:hypothetical protein